MIYRQVPGNSIILGGIDTYCDRLIMDNIEIDIHHSGCISALGCVQILYLGGRLQGKRPQ
jgi:hypothetical protein